MDILAQKSVKQLCKNTTVLQSLANDPCICDKKKALIQDVLRDNRELIHLAANEKEARHV